MRYTLAELVDGWFKNSTDWPFAPSANIDTEVDAFMADGCAWSRDEVRAEIERFWRDNPQDQTARLRKLCEQHAGEHYESHRWMCAADYEDWSNHWPVIDSDGKLTGDVVESGDTAGYTNVDDMAMQRR